MDDTPENIEVIGTILREKGYKITFANSGGEALDMASSKPPDLILLDVRMPGMDGFEVCRRLKAKKTTRDIPIIFLTVATEPEAKLKGLEMSAVDYITKPFQPAEVVVRVEKQLTIRNLQKRLKEQNRCLQQEITIRERVEEELRVHQTELETQNKNLHQAEQQLVKSRDRYADLYDFAPVSYFTVAEKNLILETNLTGANLLGVDRILLIKKPFSRFVVRDSQDTFCSHRKHIFETKTRQTCELKMLKEDGAQFDARLESIAVQDSEGEFSRFRTAVIDITERKRAEETLRESEERYRLVVEDQTEIICRFKPDGAYSFVNDVF
ncbi:MAG: response regulator, partial [Deltaproteobacteria bacterium]|nr:response regulator [Deltaproteobacteria bacterium]